ncbi:hypothetical protein BDV06DRAFT_192606 [Aspergillus oleicola]
MLCSRASLLMQIPDSGCPGGRCETWLGVGIQSTSLFPACMTGRTVSTPSLGPQFPIILTIIWASWFLTLASP